MASRKTRSKLPDDAPWRTLSGEKPIPRISQTSISVRQASNFHYAVSIMKHPDPVGLGLATEALVEAAGPDCIVPGLVKPIKVLGLQVWPIPFQVKVDLKPLEPIGRELRTLSKLLERAFDLTQAPFGR